MRRSAIALIIPLTLGLLVAPLVVEAQQARKVYRIGRLAPGSPGGNTLQIEVFRQALHELGYVEDQTIVLEERWAEGKLEWLPDLAAELVQLPVHVIVAGNVPAARAARQATGRIPIVLAGGDAVGVRSGCV
jgi:putative tryptophan/tyrosine transport system substrate-binding protein